MDVSTLLPEEEGYPPPLRALAVPPMLRVRGRYDVSAPAVTVVGTRQPSERGRAFAFEVGYTLARAGFTVVSGGALGIDEAAHCGALQAGGQTVAWIGSGLGKVGREHVDLFEAIVALGGGLVSAFKDDDVAQRHHFFKRNELMALIGRTTLLVECGVRSGARNTMKHARTHGRPRLAVPHAPWTRGVGTGLELQQGARVVLTVDECVRAASGAPAPRPEEVAATLLERAPLREVPAARGRDAPAIAGPTRPPPTPQGSPVARAILARLSVGSLTAAELAEGAGDEQSSVFLELFQLEVDGAVRLVAGRYELTAACAASRAARGA